MVAHEKPSSLPDSMVREFFSRHTQVAAVYPMPEPERNDVVRLAVVVDGDLADVHDVLFRDIHALQLELDALIDTFLFSPANCPECLPGLATYSRDGSFESDGSGYDPYNESDPMNSRKIAIIRSFADFAEANPAVVSRIVDLMDSSGSYFHDDCRRAHEDDWATYLCEYPLELQLRFFRSDSAHLKEICASSPILMFRSEWERP